MKTKTYTLLAVAAWLSAAAMVTPVNCQASSKPAPLGSIAKQVLQYFQNTGKVDLTDHLKSIRPAGVSSEQRARVVASILNEDIITPSPVRQAKLDAIGPVLQYHERCAIEVKILRLRWAWAAMLDNAAILISEEALDLLTIEELQAVVAHELGHEYFALEYDRARQNKQYDTVKEVELRCDAVSIITMKSLGLNPRSLISAVTKLTRFNERRGANNNSNLMPSLEERASFWHAMIALAEDGQASPHFVSK